MGRMARVKKLMAMTGWRALFGREERWAQVVLKRPLDVQRIGAPIVIDTLNGRLTGAPGDFLLRAKDDAGQICYAAIVPAGVAPHMFIDAPEGLSIDAPTAASAAESTAQ